MASSSSSASSSGSSGGEEAVELLSQGAEAMIYGTVFLGRPAICKERLKKRYRVSILDDKINKQRLLHEARCIGRCQRHGIAVPR